ncbi:helix-turn-helix domain-containing protein [Dongia sp.]|uniref:helix-turn-helix domain-containing protein n=1 Tax=Dongia sp. TaxID=1977262 RepID=UPI0035B3738B
MDQEHQPPLRRAGKSRGKGKPNPIDIHVGRRLHTRRTQLGLSQERLAKAIGLTFQQIQKYETGINRVSSSRLFDLARALEIDVTYFFSGIENGLADAVGAVPLVPTNEGDPLEQRETIELVRAYYRIKNVRVRRQLVELARSLGKER